MKESELLSLISKNEGPAIDFKRELTLDSAKVKAELVKDIIALANSDAPLSYLVIGVDDNKNIIGISKLGEERIQQIAYRYITPPVNLLCNLITLTTKNFLKIGVITIQTANRPHKVSSPIEQLSQDEVFVRRGSITTKASPEEIIRMHNNQARFIQEISQFKRAAEIHIKLGNFSNAIASLSRAIEIEPTSELFLTRADTYRKLNQTDRSNKARPSWGELALKDLENAILLSDSIETELRARKMRRGFAGVAYENYTSEQREKDFEFEKENLSGVERGKWICKEVADWDPFSGADEYTFSLLDEAIESGYHEPEVYYLLSAAYHGSCNYGFALDEIERLIYNVGDSHQDIVKFLCLKSKILVEMKKFKEARDTLIKARDIDEEELFSEIYINPFGIEEDILCRCLIEKEFTRKGVENPLDDVMLFLINALGTTVTELITSIDGKEIFEFKTILDDLEKKYPGTLDVVHKIIGDESWDELRTGKSELRWFRVFPDAISQIKWIQQHSFAFIKGDKRHYFAALSVSDHVFANRLE
jgi:tetratricopeptide (TPR) repeat protein